MIPSERRPGKNDVILVTGIFLLAIVLRLYAFFNTPIINSDGVRYINQAKAISIGNWELAKNCGYDFISLYHVLIPVFYTFSGDWILAAKTISLLFGTISLIPLYFMLRQFFRTSTTAVISFAFAIHPFFVANSIGLVKDPIFWFFAILGMFFFVYGIRDEKKVYFLIASNVAFLIGSLARFELLIYIAGSILYIFLFEQEKAKKVLFFMMPLTLLSVFIIGYQSFFRSGDVSLWSYYVLPRIQHFFKDFSYGLFNAAIFKKSLIALGLFISKLMKVLALQLAPFFCIGILTAWGEMRRDKCFRYFLLLAILSAAALFLFYIKMGVLSPRYTVFIVIPCMVFVAFGIETTMFFFKKRGLQERTVLWFICLYILITAFLFPSESILHKTDKVVYKKVGEYIAEIEKDQTVFVIAPDPRVIFYANLRSSVIECRHFQVRYENLKKMPYEEMVAVMKTNAAQYFLWEKKEWKDADYDFLAAARPQHFRKMMQWGSDQDALILFNVVY